MRLFSFRFAAFPNSFFSVLQEIDVNSRDVVIVIVLHMTCSPISDSNCGVLKIHDGLSSFFLSMSILQVNNVNEFMLHASCWFNWIKFVPQISSSQVVMKKSASLQVSDYNFCKKKQRRGFSFHFGLLLLSIYFDFDKSLKEKLSCALLKAGLTLAEPTFLVLRRSVSCLYVSKNVFFLLFLVPSVVSDSEEVL